LFLAALEMTIGPSGLFGDLDVLEVPEAAELIVGRYLLMLESRADPGRGPRSRAFGSVQRAGSNDAA